jgi:putative ABC transport system permease protein
MVAEAYTRMLASLRDTNGIGYAAAASHLPLTGNDVDSTTVAEGKNIAPGSEPSPMVRLVTDDFFEAIGMTIIRGRSIQARDVAAGSPQVVVVNERLAAALWPGEDPIGKRLSTWYGRDNPEWREVIGVVADVRSSGQTAPAPMELFLPYTQAPVGAWTAFQRSMALILGSTDNWPETYVPAIRQALRGVDPGIPLFAVRTMESVFVQATASRRFYLRLVLVLAVSGLGLALLGIYGVVSFVVTQRTPEIGLRLAIGAERREVVAMVIGQALRMTAIGLAIGIPAALMLTRGMTAVLFDTQATDPLTFVSVTFLLVVTSAAAAVVPASRAARVDPLVALRHE